MPAASTLRMKPYPAAPSRGATQTPPRMTHPGGHFLSVTPPSEPSARSCATRWHRPSAAYFQPGGQLAFALSPAKQKPFTMVSPGAHWLASMSMTRVFSAAARDPPPRGIHIALSW